MELFIHDSQDKEQSEMQATLNSKRNRWEPVVMLLVLAVALMLGGTVGYLVKPSSAIAAPGHVILMPAAGARASTGDECIFVNHHKGC